MKPSQWIHTEPAIIFKMKSDREMCSEKKQKAWMIHMNLIENLVLIHYARKLCMCVLTLVAHSRAFFTIEAPALNDFSFYHYHQRTRLQLLLCVHFDQIPLDNRTTRRWCSSVYICVCLLCCFFQVVWIVAPTTTSEAVLLKPRLLQI